MRKVFTSILEVAEVAIVALLAVISIRTFLVQPFLVSGASMVPTFSNGDYLLIDELTYRFRPPERGEVIVFKYPKDESTYFIKRIIGLPGDKVEIKDGKVIVTDAQYPQGKVIGESYLPAGTLTVTRAGESTAYTVPQGEYFVLGDNRPYSFDSRDWGFVKKDEVVGLVRLRLWPLPDITVFSAPAYNN